MQTYSHVILAAFVAQRFKGRTTNAVEVHGDERAPAFRSKAFLLGSVAPDIPLILLTVLFLARDLITGTTGGNGSNVERLFRYQFYHDPWVIAAHNLFHAPLLLLFYGGMGYVAWRQANALGTRAFLVRGGVHDAHADRYPASS